MNGSDDIAASEDRGEPIESERLLPVVYEELRRLAASRMSKESGNQTLQPTALVHEAYISLTKNGDVSWQNRAHFFGAAALAMRRILVDRSRGKAALKRKSDMAFQDLDDSNLVPGDHILMIHESLNRLEKEDPAAAHLVLLKFYSGLSSAEIAELLQRSVRSIERQWTLAKARLYQMIREEGFIP